MGCCSSHKNVTVPDVSPIEEPAPVTMLTNEKMKVFSKFTINEVKISKLTPKETQEICFKFECPICMYFFSAILVTRCCKNYICHYCTEEMKSFKENSACPHCRAKPLILEDTKPGDGGKTYIEKVTQDEGGKQDVEMTDAFSELFMAKIEKKGI